MANIPSPLTFARDYSAYRARAASIAFADTRLLTAARFWRDHSEALGEPAFESFWREDLPPLLTGAEPSTFVDLLPDELEEIAAFLEQLPSTFTTSVSSAPFWELAAKAWFYVGDVDCGLTALSHTGVGAGLRPALTDAHDESSVGSAPPTIPADSLAGVDAVDLTRFLIDQSVPELGPAVIAWLERFDAEWRAQRDGGTANQAICVLVEHDEAPRPVRGRLRLLQGQVEALSDKSGTDQVVFSHQLRASDDPQISGAYAALAALRHIPNSAFHTPHSATRGNFEFLGSGGELYGGDSLGFACFATAYGDWWSKDLHRERRLISGSVVFSGALNDDGLAASVSESSLQKKVERVFFSPLSHLVVPEANRADAEAAVERLRRRHPARRLRINGVERASDIVADHNIFIPERVCLGEYAVRAAAKYTRSVKVQVPILAILGYLLLCLIYPRLWVGFDMQPAEVKATADGITVLNGAGHLLGSYTGFPGTTHFRSFSAAGTGPDYPNAYYRFADLDRDGQDEVLCCVPYVDRPKGLNTSPLYAFRVRRFGGLDSIFAAPISTPTGYRGDTDSGQALTYNYALRGLYTFQTQRGSLRLLVVSANSEPARCQIQVFDSAGTRVGFYLNQGHFNWTAIKIEDIDHDGTPELCLGGANNRLRRACIAILDPNRIWGVSPPWDVSQFSGSGMPKGSQKLYVAFARSDLCDREGLVPYNMVVNLDFDSTRGLRADVFESQNAAIEYQFDSSLTIIHCLLGEVFYNRYPRIFGHPPSPGYELDLTAAAMLWRDSVRLQ
jgi:hypothetical protein